MTDDAFYLQRRRRGGVASAALQPLSIRGRHFVTPDDEIQKLCSWSGFRIGQVFHTDLPRAREFLAAGRAIGKRMVRWFYTHGAPPYDTWLPPVDFGLVNECHHFLREEGFYAHAVGLTCHVESDNDWIADRRGYLEQCANTIRDNGHAPYVLFEIQNEAFKRDLTRDIPASIFDGLMACRSCYTGTELVDLQWASLHPERKAPPPEADERKIHDLIEIPFGGPRGIGEPNKASESNPQSYRRQGRLARLLGEIWTGHDLFDGSIQSCHVPPPDTLKILQAGADGFNDDTVIPANASDGAYGRDEGAAIQFTLGGPLVGGYGVQHVYFTRLGNDEYGVLTAPSDDFRTEAKSGWEIVSKVDRECYHARRA